MISPINQNTMWQENGRKTAAKQTSKAPLFDILLGLFFLTLTLYVTNACSKHLPGTQDVPSVSSLKPSVQTQSWLFSC